MKNVRILPGDPYLIDKNGEGGINGDGFGFGHQNKVNGEASGLGIITHEDIGLAEGWGDGASNETGGGVIGYSEIYELSDTNL